MLVDVKSTCTAPVTNNSVGICVLLLVSVSSDHLARHWYKLCASNGLTEEGDTIAVLGSWVRNGLLVMGEYDSVNCRFEQPVSPVT